MHMKYISRFGAILAVFLVAGVAQAQSVTVTSGSDGTATSLQSQAQALLQEIQTLQAQLAAGNTSGVSTGSTGTANSSSCPQISRTLRYGSTGSDVSRLQAFLAQDSSVYPEGTVSGYYGSLTQAAVQRWQAKYNIVSSGSPSTTGYGIVGPRTAAAIALLCSTGKSSSSSSSSSGTTASPVGGFIQVSPISGNATLTVTVQATVNSTNSCDGATYTLSFGDGTASQQIVVPSGTCTSQTQTFTHSYYYGGTYQVLLAAGSHHTSAAVTVYGSSAPSSGTTQTTPTDSIRASVTSGTAPLTVTFSGTISSASAPGCSGTCNETVNFGDGSVGLVPVPTTDNSWQSYQLQHTYSSAGTYVVSLESVSGSQIGSTISITVSSSGSSTSSSGSSSTGGSYGVISVTPSSSSIYSVSAVFSIPSCAQYQVDWGDSTAVSTVTGACQSGGSTVQVSHTYSAAGSYTIKLNDGSGNKQASSAYSITS